MKNNVYTLELHNQLLNALLKNRKDSNMFTSIPNPEELQKLYDGVDKLAVAMKKRLAQKHGAGFTGWDDSRYIHSRNKQDIIEHAGRIAAGEHKEVDLANFVLFRFHYNNVAAKSGDMLYKESLGQVALPSLPGGFPGEPAEKPSEHVGRILSEVYNASPGTTVIDELAGTKYTKQPDGRWLKGTYKKPLSKRKTPKKGRKQ